MNIDPHDRTETQLTVCPTPFADPQLELALAEGLAAQLVGPRPRRQSRASSALIATSMIICAIGIALPFTPMGDALKFTPLPPLYWPIVASFLLSYAILTHLVKTWFVRRWGM